MTVRPGLVSSIGLAIIVALGACAAAPVKVDYFYAEVPHSSITASAIAAGAYRGISSRELARLNGESGVPIVALGFGGNAER
jgi:hypothetical protein